MATEDDREEGAGEAKIARDLSTQENREFWANIERAASRAPGVHHKRATMPFRERGEEWEIEDGEWAVEVYDHEAIFIGPKKGESQISYDLWQATVEKVLRVADVGGTPKMARVELANRVAKALNEAGVEVPAPDTPDKRS